MFTELHTGMGGGWDISGQRLEYRHIDELIQVYITYNVAWQPNKFDPQLFVSKSAILLACRPIML